MRRRLVAPALLVVGVLTGVWLWSRPRVARPPPSPPATSDAARAARPARPSPLMPVPHDPAVSLVAPPPLAPAPAPASGAFEGHVRSARTGAAVAGAHLTFARAEEVASVAAGPDGAFRFEPRAAGRWWLAAATAPGYLPFAPRWGQSPVQLEAVPGTVVRGLQVALVPAIAYEGRVIDLRDQPVPGVDISVLGSAGGGAGLVPSPPPARSDAAGRFRFSAPDEALLEARRQGFAVARARVDYQVRLSGRITIRLRPAEAAPLAIGGTVEDASGAPAEDVEVIAVRQPFLGEAPAAARTDARGRFEVTGLAEGRWSLTATRAGAAPAWAEVAAGTTGVRLRLRAGGAVAGSVRERATGAPVPTFTLIIQDQLLRTASVVDPAGRYALDDLAPGPAVISAVAPGLAPSPEQRVVVPEPGAPPARLDFELSAGSRLSGTVVERRSSQPIAGARVQVEGSAGAEGFPLRGEAVTDEAGRFELTGLPEGPTGIFASAPGHHARVLTLPAWEGPAREPVRIDLTPLAAGEEAKVELAGIGAALAKEGAVFRILSVLPGGGAAEVGLGAGDDVLAIEGAPVASMTLGEAIPLLRGPEGTAVTLSVVRYGDASRTALTVRVPRRLVRG